MAKQKTLAESRAENRLLKRGHWANALAAVLTTAMKYGTLAYGFRQIYLSVAALAGKQTVADLAFKFLASVGISKWLAYALGAGGLTYGWFQQRARRRIVSRLGPRVKDYEAAIDPGRSSSELTPAGDTPRDTAV